MTYARIVNGVVTQIIENVTLLQIFTRLGFKFGFNKRIDHLSPMPQVGWRYSNLNGFTEN